MFVWISQMELAESHSRTIPFCKITSKYSQSIINVLTCLMCSVVLNGCINILRKHLKYHTLLTIQKQSSTTSSMETAIAS